MRYEAIEALSPPPNRTYKRIPHERMGGTVPVWESAKSAPATPAKTTTTSTINPITHSTFQETPSQASANNGHAEEFGFADMIDIINPLHHIPLVGQLYRAATGDQIKASTQIIGGTLFGGPLGGIGSLANTIMKHELGKPEATHAIANTNSHASATELALSNAYSITNSQDDDMARTLLSFADLGNPKATIDILSNPEKPTRFYIKQTADYND